MSPCLHNWIFEKLGISASYEKIKVDDDGLNSIINRIREGQIDGINVTIPFKEKVILYWVQMTDTQQPTQ